MDRSPRCLAWLAAVACAGATVLPAQTTDCSDPRARQFDFWIGEWQVTSGDDLAGSNSIQPILDGCVLQETWQGAQGSAGSSFNFFNPRTESWHQFWVWRNGTTLELEGGYADGKMVLEGVSRDGQGAEILNRVTWYDLPDGTVRQHWEQSRDQGGQWSTAFDGLYRKRGQD